LFTIMTKIPFCEETKSYFKVTGNSEVWNQWNLMNGNHAMTVEPSDNYREFHYSDKSIGYYDLPSGTVSLWARLFDENDKDDDIDNEDEDIGVKKANVCFKVYSERIAKGKFEMIFCPIIERGKRYTLNITFYNKKIAQIPKEQDTA